MNLPVLKDLRDVALFNAIVSSGSLSAAGRQLGLSLAVVSKRLTQMEQQLGVRLFHRTTRHVSLTDEGLVFSEHAQRLQHELEAIDNALANRLDRASGTLRMDADGNVLRAPAWSTFSGGHVVPLAGSGG